MPEGASSAANGPKHNERESGSGGREGGEGGVS